MAEDQQQQYHDRAQAALLPICIAAPTTEDEHATTTSSPWGIGSCTYPCSASTVQSIAAKLMPEGRAWLRKAYDQCRAATQPEALANCIAKNVEPAFDLTKLRRRRLRDATCFQVHPGLCCQVLLRLFEARCGRVQTYTREGSR